MILRVPCSKTFTLFCSLSHRVLRLSCWCCLRWYPSPPPSGAGTRAAPATTTRATSHHGHGHKGGLDHGHGHKGSLHHGHGHKGNLYHGHKHDGGLHNSHGHKGELYHSNQHKGSIGNKHFPRGHHQTWTRAQTFPSRRTWRRSRARVQRLRRYRGPWWRRIRTLKWIQVNY